MTPMPDCNGNTGNKTIEEKLAMYEEKEHTRWQLKTVCVELLILIARVAIVYWIFTLAMTGAKEIESHDIAAISQAILFAISLLWVLSECLLLMPYRSWCSPIWNDAQEGFEILAAKIRCANKAWRDCKVTDEEELQ